MDSGLTHPVVCFLDGATKPIDTALDPATYKRIGAMRKEYLATDPRRVR